MKPKGGIGVTLTDSTHLETQVKKLGASDWHLNGGNLAGKSLLPTDR